ncbi:MAG TPA: NAD(P)(+) transhydrogenase (Re/Si-specific) subunit beta, partial [Solirubrobacterales bacterium]|nr:NAD(P)(+) transhydrogenase (Re/Si-specific) subunit beta [Solirubrobacterales bacterium]
MDKTTAVSLAYLLAAVLFILGLRQLSSPKGARRGNWTAAIGMVVALGTTLALLAVNPAGFVVIVAAVAIGAVVGTVSARRVQMTAMPQMVAIFNGVGGGAAALVSIAEFTQLNGAEDLARVVPSVFTVVIGSISFAGSCIAFSKLQELMTGRPITYPGQQVVNGALALLIVALAVWVVVAGHAILLFALLAAALLLGVAFVLPIGGADMPVVISLLNAFTGLAVAASGFVLGNFALIVAGTLVGASGSLLTRLMSVAMGRSIANILFGAFGAVATGGAVEAGA